MIEQNGWISCDKILPEWSEMYDPDLMVLLAVKTSTGYTIEKACRVIKDTDGDWTWDYGEGIYPPLQVTHWMPLPDPPLDYVNDISGEKE